MKDEKMNISTKKCLICGKESTEDICKSCENKIQAEAFYKKKKEESEKK
jgi:hypothetical protein